MATVFPNAEAADMAERLSPIAVQIIGEWCTLPRQLTAFHQTGSLRVTESYNRLDGRDIIDKSKTKKSERVIALPRFLAQELQEYMKTEREPNENERLFPFAKYALDNTLKTAAKLAGVKEIRVRDLMNPNLSLDSHQAPTAPALHCVFKRCLSQLRQITP